MLRRPIHLSRTFLVCLSLAAGPASIALAADMTARDVIGLLFKGERGRIDLAGKDLSELDLAGLDFKSATMEKANLYGADLSGALLAGANLAGARLDRATIIGAEFSSANLEGATLLRPNVFTSFSPDQREAPRFAGARMAGASIIARLDFADFRWADLSRATFGVSDPRIEVLLTSRVTLDAADFSEATLREASLVGASLRFAHFNRADLTGADLRSADLTRADFTGADVTGLDVTGANLDEANFSGARGFSAMKGLALARNAERVSPPN